MSAPTHISLSKPQLKAIFESLGTTHAEREARLAKILSEFYQLAKNDVLIGFYFDQKDVEAIAQLQKSFLMKAMGAAISYSGLAPAKAHLKLAPILSGHFDRRLRILEQVLNQNQVAPAHIHTWIQFEACFREGVVTGPAPGTATGPASS